MNDDLVLQYLETTEDILDINIRKLLQLNYFWQLHISNYYNTYCNNDIIFNN